VTTKGCGFKPQWCAGQIATIPLPMDLTWGADMLLGKVCCYDFFLNLKKCQSRLSYTCVEAPYFEKASPWGVTQNKNKLFQLKKNLLRNEKNLSHPFSKYTT